MEEAVALLATFIDDASLPTMAGKRQPMGVGQAAAVAVRSVQPSTFVPKRLPPNSQSQTRRCSGEKNAHEK